MTRYWHRRGFSILELLVAIMVMSLLASLLLPALSASRAAARTAQCASNLHNLGILWNERLLTQAGRPLQPSSWQTEFAAAVKTKDILACPSAEVRPQSSSLSCQVTHGGWPEQLIPLEPGPRCQKRNSTAASYELWFEDWNNWDFRDLRLLVEQMPDTSEKITVIQVDSSSTFDLVFDDGTPAMARINKNNWPGRSLTTRSGMVGYGINNRCASFTPRDGRRILMLDYQKTVASVVGADASDDFTSQVAPRHSDRVNVLYVDGSVSTLDPASIDPADLQIHDTLWKPLKDAPLASPAR